MGKLPGWAKTKIIQSTNPGLQSQGDGVKSRWADRTNHEINIMRSFEDTPFNNPGEEDSSHKDGSSLEWAR